MWKSPKSNFLRYANPDVSVNSPLKLNDREQYNNLEADITKFLQDIPVSLISVVLDKKKYWSEEPAQNPYEMAYLILLERFQKYLEEKKSLGICIIAPLYHLPPLKTKIARIFIRAIF